MVNVGVALKLCRIHQSTTIDMVVIPYTSVSSYASYLCALVCTHVCVFMRAETSAKQMMANGHGNTHTERVRSSVFYI